MNKLTIVIAAAVATGIGAVIIAGSSPPTPEQLAQIRAASEQRLADAKAASEQQAQADARVQAKDQDAAQITGNLRAEDAISEPYDELMRHPQDHMGELIRYRGKVLQVVWEDHRAQLRIEVTQKNKSFDLWDDAVLVWYAPSPGEARILEKDIVEFWGRYAGVQTYTAVLGNIVQIPGVTAYGLTRSTIVTQETETGCVIHLAQFQALKTGMSYAAAMSTLGCEGTEISRVDLPGAPQFATVMYSWKGAAIANANAMFQNDRLINKAQVGLQ